MSISDMSLDELEANETVLKAVFFDFIVMGKATVNIPVEIRDRAPDLTWKKMSGMRNIITHEYFRIDPNILWDPIQDDLPSVVPSLQALLQNEEEEDI